MNLDRQIIQVFSPLVAKTYRVLPVKRSGQNLWVAMDDPDNHDGIEKAESETGCNILRVFCTKEALDKAIEKYYGSD